MEIKCKCAFKEKCSEYNDCIIELSSELNINELLDIIREINAYQGGYEDLSMLFSSMEDLIEYYNMSAVEVAKAIMFGNVESWYSDYFRLDINNNIESISEYWLYREINEVKSEIMQIYIEGVLKNRYNEKYYKKLLTLLEDMI